MAHPLLAEAERAYDRSRNAMDASTFGGRTRTEKALAEVHRLRAAAREVDELLAVGTVVDQEAVEAAGEGLELDLTGVYVLPQATLKELAAKGVIMSVMTFEDHMNPTVHWIEPEEFGRAFEELTSGENSMADDKFEAAHTDPNGGGYPSFINARAGLVPGTVLITVRSAKSPDGSHGDGAALDGATAHHIIDIESLDQWIADLQRLRQALG